MPRAMEVEHNKVVPQKFSHRMVKNSIAGKIGIEHGLQHGEWECRIKVLGQNEVVKGSVEEEHLNSI